jgi:hypothetical protein
LETAHHRWLEWRRRSLAVCPGSITWSFRYSNAISTTRSWPSSPSSTHNSQTRSDWPIWLIWAMSVFHPLVPDSLDLLEVFVPNNYPNELAMVFKFSPSLKFFWDSTQIWMTCLFREADKGVVSYQPYRSLHSTSSRVNRNKQINDRHQNEKCKMILSMKIKTINTVLRSPTEAVKVSEKSYSTVSFCELEWYPGLKFMETHRTRILAQFPRFYCSVFQYRVFKIK